MKKKSKKSPSSPPQKKRPLSHDVFSRVSTILDEARLQTARSVNTWMVVAYWLIGREIVQVEQAGKERADYGMKIIQSLSAKLTAKYGRGFSYSNLRNFRDFFLAYQERIPEKMSTSICYPTGSKLPSTPIGSPTGSQLQSAQSSICYPLGSKSEVSFHPNLGWSHYRALMRVEKPEARAFYEEEAIKGTWNKRELERQINSLYYERLLMSKNKKEMLEKAHKKEVPLHPLDVIKDPYVLEFLNLPENHQLSETDLETALIGHLQSFLLEMGQGFAFVGRQQRLTLDGDHFYADLVFYHVRLKCYVIIDLKTQKLTHADLGQMQLYVNYYDREIAEKSDNPTLGLILCTDKNDATVKYVLDKGQEKIFASRYKMIIPSEKELALELRKEMAQLGFHQANKKPPKK